MLRRPPRSRQSRSSAASDVYKRQILACALADKAGAAVTLVEKSPRKSEFLRAVGKEVGLPVAVLTIRLEDAPGVLFDVVTARALAPLPKLLGFAASWLKPSGKALLLKGRDTAAELAEALLFVGNDFAQTDVVPAMT